MKLKLNKHQIEGAQVVDVLDEQGRVAGTIISTRTGLRITSEQLMDYVTTEKPIRAMELLFRQEQAA